MARGTRLAILASVILVIGGCGSGASSPAVSSPTSPSAVVATPSAPPTATPVASPSSALTALTSQYRSLATKGDAAVVECNKAKVAALGSLEKSKAAAHDCLTVYSQYVAAMKSVDWGPVQAQADKVIGVMDRIDSLTGQMANAPDEAAFTAAYKKLATAAEELLADANALRAALGLPPVTL